MSEEFSKPCRKVVMPGELLEEEKLKAGAGTYVSDGNIYSAIMGFKTVKSNYVNVVPLSGRYIPNVGDNVIGIVEDVGPSNWLIEINSPYPAPLHVNEVPWRVEFGDTSRYMKIGDALLVKVLMVDETMKVQVTMKEQGLRKLQGGEIVEIAPHKVPRVIGKSGSMIQLIKGYTNCRVFVGQNGRIWLDGETENIGYAYHAIKMIDEAAHSSGLTDRVKAYLESVAQPVQESE